MSKSKHISTLAKPSVGDTVKDKLTGIEGVVVAKMFHIHGCNAFKAPSNQPRSR